MESSDSLLFEFDGGGELTRAKRKGITDVWNSFMVVDAKFDCADIPVCPSTALQPPEQVISWPEAKRLHGKMLRHGHRVYKHPAFVHFFVDDSKFDGKHCGIWQRPMRAYAVLNHFAGVITPDFSTNQDFPEPVKEWATYRMRAFGFWLGTMGVPVINNVRWGTIETWRYCFSGIPKGSLVSIGTVGGSPRKLCDKSRFETGFDEMISRVEPSAIVVVGSAGYACFEKAAESGVRIVQFPSETATAFEGRNR